MNAPYETLFRAIFAKCELEHWYGVEAASPVENDNVASDDPNRFGFVFPPATPQQLEATEELLGFALPPLLRALYGQVANGGFGPDLGFRGVLGGYGEPGTPLYPYYGGTIPAQYRFLSRTRTFELSNYPPQEGLVDLEFPSGEWLHGLLPLCDLGCVIELCVDRQQRVYYVEPTRGDSTFALSQTSWNLEEWLWSWVRGERLLPGYSDISSSGVS
jgi:hypothetical protein